METKNVLTENGKTINWKENLKPLKRDGYFNERIKFRVEFDLNEVYQLQEVNHSAISKDTLRIAILNKFGLKDERVAEVKADTLPVNEVQKWKAEIDELVNQKRASGEVVDNVRITAYINNNVPKNLQKEVLKVSLDVEKPRVDF